MGALYASIRWEVTEVRTRTFGSVTSILILCCLTSVSPTLFGADASLASEHAPSAQAEVIPKIAASEMARLEEKALEGNAEAAVRLARDASSFGNSLKRIYWLMIAVENGDSEDRFNLARALMQSGNVADKIRGRYWYRRIIGEGSAEESAVADRELKAWDSYEKTYQPHDGRF